MNEEDDMKLTKKTASILTAIENGEAYFCGGWRSAPHRPARASGIYVNGVHVATRAMFFKLRDDAKFIRQNWDVTDANGDEQVLLTDAARSALKAA